ncbi:hypothetical protein PCANC_12416 [Puccinia coronata f. sp. avenae]|uniref:Uncharacterized protein n=1 Tax=Puccinia coronata f. sp. avenae TaxID=200324 RepID=A0A2N5SG58_9BASI|nr:hypothetical protein PCANC_18813 [Puccinia coronata f. sp. avenae]PLW47274.1 hypothetical protein PCANC_12416 [Puccinia coronata f. sp. avenae]
MSMEDSSCSFTLSTCARGHGSPFLNRVGRPEPDAQVANPPHHGASCRAVTCCFSQQRRTIAGRLGNMIAKIV